MGGFGSTRWVWFSTKDTVEGNRSLDSIGRDVSAQAIEAATNRRATASGSPRSGSGETEIVYSCCIGSDGTLGNGGMSNSQHRSSGRRADSAVSGRISSVRELSTELPVDAGCRSSMGQGNISYVAIVIDSPTPHSEKIAMTGHCGGPIISAGGLAESRAQRRRSLLGQRACIIRLTSAFNLRY